jgi:FkbM family methyltransferase
VPLDPRAVEWLEQTVDIGDVVYDVNAGVGSYVLVAARQRGAVVVAFEPGYEVYAALCENILLNGCQATVIPVPLALADEDGLADMKYEREFPGHERYSIRPTDWRVRPDQGVRPYVQPVCATRLDTAIERYTLPAPNHLRLSRYASALDVLRGAPRTLDSAELRTIWARVAPADEEPMSALLARHGLHAAVRHERGRSVQLVFDRRARAPLANAGAAKGMQA